MADRYDLIVEGGTCLTPGGAADVDIGVRAGRIAAIGSLANIDAEQRFRADKLHVLPGVVDTQVHFREPGAEHKEDLESGTRAAVLGGVTAVFEMPNTRPATTSAERLADKLARASGRAWCDHAFFVGATPENTPDLAELERLPGCSGVKMFMGSSTGDLLVADDAGVAGVLTSGSRRVAVHSEDEARLKERQALIEAEATAHMHPVWRDEITALAATQRLVKLAEEAGRRIHVLHTTTAEEMALLAGHKRIATVEVTPQHLTLAAPDCYDRLGNYARMNPPIRDGRHRDALWAAVRDGIVDVIGSDHAPHAREEKEKSYSESPSGMPGVQTLVPIMLDHVNRGRLSLERVVDLTSAGPARIYGIAGKGRIAVGYDADLTIVDLAHKRTIDNDWIASKCSWTPFDGVAVTGWPKATVIRGSIVMREDETLGAPDGQPVRFLETL
ncbi:MAG: dihydroorotase [Alphaproteobacteria bacterium]|nr:dihydroorotase [Alphaproteobacteria bacterium]